MAAGKLEVIVTAKIDQLQEGLRRVEASVQDTQAKISKLDNGMQAFQGTAAKAAKALGVVALAGAAAEESVNILTRSVHMAKGGLALLSGDTTKAMKSLEAFGNSIREIPILGSIIGGIADSIFELGDAFLGLREKNEELGKELAKTFSSLQLTTQAKDIQKQNKLLDLQKELISEANESRKVEIQLEMDLAKLAQEQAARRVEITRLKKDDPEAAALALGQLEDNLALQTDILELKAKQAKEEIKAIATAKTLADSEARRLEIAMAMEEQKQIAEQIKQQEELIKSLEREAGILSETDELRRAGLEHQDEMIKLRNRILKQIDQVKNNEALSEDQKNKMIDLLNKQFAREKEILDIKAEQAEKTIKQAEAEEKLTKQKEEQKRLVQELEELNKQAEGRQGQIRTRLGSAATQMKSGFTETGNTAMGQFTFGERDAQSKIRDLNKEQADIQKQIEQRSARIEQLLEALATDFGVK